MLNRDKMFKVYQDPGHGWMAVKYKELEYMGLVGNISPYSYIWGDTVYLEEDRDMGIFVQAWKAFTNNAPMRIQVRSTDKNSVIRSYDRFKARDGQL